MRKMFPKWLRQLLHIHITSGNLHAFPNLRNMRCVKGKLEWGENRWGFGMRSKIICFGPNWLPYHRLGSITHLMKNPRNTVDRKRKIQLTEFEKYSWRNLRNTVERIWDSRMVTKIICFSLPDLQLASHWWDLIATSVTFFLIANNLWRTVWWNTL